MPLDHAVIVFAESDIETLVQRMQYGPHKLRTKNVKKYKNVFHGFKLILWLIKKSNGLVSNRVEALALFEHLIKESYIANAEFPTLLKYNHFNYYHFTNRDDEKTDLEESTGDYDDDERDESEETDLNSSEEEIEHTSTKVSLLKTKQYKYKFDTLIEEFRKEFGRNPFTGKEAMSWMNNYLNSDEEWTKCQEIWKTCPKDIIQYIIDLGLVSAYKSKIALDSTFNPNKSKIKYILTEDPSPYAINLLKLRSKKKRIGQAMKIEMGAKPKSPVIIIPGFSSTALEIWESESISSWVGDRIWVAPSKIAHHSVQLHKKNKKVSQPEVREDDENLEDISFNVSQPPQSQFLYHLLLEDDGVSDPKGVKVRACEGINSVDYLSNSLLSQKVTFAFAYIIEALRDVGYDHKNMEIAGYDWRLPITYLEERDGYFTILKAKIEVLFKINNNSKVIPICHSMGNKIFAYFLKWVERTDESWADKYIEGWLSMGAPFLGAPKAMRSVISGDCIGLDLFLQMKDSVKVARSMGSLPALFPHYHNLLPCPMIHLTKSESAAQIEEFTQAKMREYSANWKVLNEMNPKNQYNIVTQKAWKWFQFSHIQNHAHFPLSNDKYEPMDPITIGGTWCIYDPAFSSKITDLLSFLPEGVTSSLNSSSLSQYAVSSPHSYQLLFQMKPDHNKIFVKALLSGYESTGIVEESIFHQINDVNTVFFGEGKQISFIYQNAIYRYTLLPDGSRMGSITRIFRFPSSQPATSLPEVEIFQDLANRGEEGLFIHEKFIFLLPNFAIKSVVLTHKKLEELPKAFLRSNSESQWFNLVQPYATFYPQPMIANFVSASTGAVIPAALIDQSVSNNNNNTTIYNSHNALCSSGDSEVQRPNLSNSKESAHSTSSEENKVGARTLDSKLQNRIAEISEKMHSKLSRFSREKADPQDNKEGLHDSKEAERKHLFDMKDLHIPGLPNLRVTGKQPRGGASPRGIETEPIKQDDSPKTSKDINTLQSHYESFLKVTCNNVEPIIDTPIVFSAKFFGGRYQIDAQKSDDTVKFFKLLANKYCHNSKSRYIQLKLMSYSHSLVKEIEIRDNGFKDRLFTQNGVKLFSNNFILYKPNPCYSHLCGLSSNYTFFSKDFLSLISIMDYPHGTVFEVRQMNEVQVASKLIYQSNTSKKLKVFVQHYNRILSPTKEITPSTSETTNNSENSNLNSTSTNTITPDANLNIRASGMYDSSAYGSYKTMDFGKPKVEPLEEVKVWDPNAFLVLSSYVPAVWTIFKKHYLSDPLYLNTFLSSGSLEIDSFLAIESNNNNAAAMSEKMENSHHTYSSSCSIQQKEIAPIFSIPKVKKFWSLYGINRDTEISYFFRHTKNGLTLDPAPSASLPAVLNLKQVGGMLYETSQTPQPSATNALKSGDGTVPYYSLFYPSHWPKMAREYETSSPYIEMIEVDNAEHRTMLADDVVIYHLLHIVCFGKTGSFLPPKNRHFVFPPYTPPTP